MDYTTQRDWQSDKCDNMDEQLLNVLTGADSCFVPDSIRTPLPH